MAVRPRGYGMTAEVRRRIDDKYDPELEQEAVDWIQAVTKLPKAVGTSFQDWLKDGVVLCTLINKIQPGSVMKISDKKMAFKMMENIGFFLAACEAYGCRQLDMFQTVDLYEARNIPQVINSVIALGRQAGSKGFKPAIAAERKKKWSREEKMAGQGRTETKKGASQAAYGSPRQIY